MDLLSYILIATFMVVLPGADTMLLIKNTLTYGRKAGRFSALGTAAGLTFWTLIAIFGLSMTIAKSVVLFNTIKYLGAAYLIYLGIKSFFSKNMFSLEDFKEHAKQPLKQVSQKGYKESFLQSLLSNILNPKTVLLYITIMPQFIDFHYHINQQLILLGLILTVLAVLWFLILVQIVDYAKKWMNNPRFQKIFQRSTGFILVSFGIKTAI
ncbi:homoserine/threonine efflux transporter [Paucisalibacillus globulus]|jgi:RhtB (resistance to homoserine/threonine) family protein|uniref:homoserine/threonine efflux transporter n=1 Tax=Paucisalibacillus globulus TaxID=351095 RepID=UPI0003FF21B2|nr:homoserine/threonine efflux transporter [Paucisalibacillus globulus]